MRRLVLSVSTGQASMLRQMREILAPHRRALILLLAAVLASAGLDLAPPLVMQRIIDEHLVPGNASGLWPLAGLYLLATGGAQAFAFLATYLTARTSQQALHSLRVRLFRHLEHLPARYHDSHPLGDSISRCTSDVDVLDTLFSSGMARMVTDLARLVTLGAAMLALSPLLSSTLLAVIPAMLGLTDYFRRRIRSAERQNRSAVGSLNAHLQETLGGVETIHAFRREPAFLRRYRSLLKKTLAAYNRSARYSAVYSPLMQILMGAIIAFILWNATGSLFPNLNISLGTLTAFVLLLKRFFDPIIAVGEDLQIIQGALAGAERIFQVLDEPVEMQPEPVKQGKSSKMLGIEMKGVTFGYTTGRPVLKNLSFTVEPGEQVVIVGRTGSGKSSVLNLVSGLYQPWEGRVRTAGADPWLMDEKSRRRMVGIVPQAVQLFSGSIRDNITLGDESIPQEAVKQAARLSGAEKLIAGLPAGYDTPVSLASGCGASLSLGQRQLISLTRALVLEPKILLFDEATAGIDCASDEAFRQALASPALRGRLAILTVAHRLAAAHTADRVIVMEDGQIVEMGRPDELARGGKTFAALQELETLRIPREAPVYWR